MRAWGKVGDTEVEFDIPPEYEEFFRLSAGSFSIRQPEEHPLWCPCRPNDNVCTWPAC